MPKKLIYAGIGSRETPKDILETMTLIAYQLGDLWLLRSGHAEGADTAFEQGCLQRAKELNIQPKMEIFLPWKNFNGAPKHPCYIVPEMDSALNTFAASFHPAWNKCNDQARKLHMRNCAQIVGQYRNEDATMVVCWTLDGKRGGGTGQALRIAEHYRIPIFDLAVAGTDQRLVDFIQEQEKQ